MFWTDESNDRVSCFSVHTSAPTVTWIMLNINRTSTLVDNIRHGYWEVNVRICRDSFYLDTFFRT